MFLLPLRVRSLLFEKLMTGKDFGSLAIPFKPVGLIFCDDASSFAINEG